MVTLEPVNYPTFLGDITPVFWGHQDVTDGVASFKIYLQPNLATYIFEALTKSPSIWSYQVDIPVLDVIVVVAISLVYVVVVMGLITTMPIVVASLKSI